MSKSILGLVLGLFLALPLMAEQPIFTIGSADANPGETVEINIHVDNFTDIVSVQYSVNWDPSVLEFVSVKNINGTIPGFNSGSIATMEVAEGKLRVQWFEASVTPITIPDGSLYFTLEFEVIGDPCDFSTIAITNDPLEIEVGEGEAGVDVGLVANNGQVNVPGVGCSEGINMIGTSVQGACGSEVCIEFTVENFTSVGAMEFSLFYDPAVIEFVRFQNYAPLPSFGNGNTNLFAPGVLRVVWFNGNIENSSLPDGTVLFEICFNVVGAGGQSSTITFGDDPPPMFDDIDENPHVVNITPAVITAQCALEGFALIAEPDTLCTEPGGIVCFDIQVNDFDDIVAMQFSMNWNPSLFVFDHVEGFGVLPDLDDTYFGVPGNPDVAEGQLTVSWLDPETEGFTVPDFSTIFTVCLRAIGAVGTTTHFTFSDVPLDLEIATNDSILEVGLVTGVAQIKTTCDGCDLGYTLVVNDPDCPGEATGSIDLSVTCPGSTFLWSSNANNATTEDVSGLAAGTYSVTITNGQQIVIATDIVMDPDPMSVTGNIIDPDPITSSTGSININVTGGTGPYTFLWSNSASSQNLLNIPCGSYTVTVTDANGCTFVPDAFVVCASITAQVNRVSCFGLCDGSITVSPSFGTGPYTFLWNTNPPQNTPQIINLCAGSYCVTITDASGSSRDSCFMVTQPPALNVTASITHDDGQGAIDLNVTGGTPPYSYLWSNGFTTQDIINLSVGEYCVTVTDSEDCVVEQCFNVFAEGGFALNLVAEQFGSFQTSCSDVCDGHITSVITGGVPPFTYLWSNNEVTEDLDNVCPGTYSLTVTDAAGSTVSSSQTITAPPALTFAITQTNPTDFTTNDGALSVLVNGGVPPYTYQWSGPVSGGGSSLNNIPAGTYVLLVEDANNCQETITVTLLPDGASSCYVGNTIITPNNDGKNDYFLITCIFGTDHHLYIFNRNGGLVYDTDEYLNNWTGVDGDGDELPDGGYLWVLEITQQDGTLRVLKGTVNVLRTAD